MDRADTIINKNTDYLHEVLENNSVRSVLAKIYRRIKRTEGDCNIWKNSCFAEFKDLYSEDSQNSFDSFLNRTELYPTETELREEDKKILNLDEEEEEPGDEGDESKEKEEDDEDNIYKINYDTTRYESIKEIFKGVRSRERTPKLNEFQKQLYVLKNKKYRRDNLKEEYNIDFLKINSKPLLHNLDEVINSYINQYSNFLFNNTDTLLKNIKKFIDRITDGIKVKPTESDKNTLYSVLKCIRDMNKVNYLVNCYKPTMKESIQILKKYDYDIDDNYLENIETTYIDWNRLNQDINKTENENVGLKKKEGNQIMERSKEFKIRLTKFKQN